MSNTRNQRTSQIEDEAALWLVTLAEAPGDTALADEFETWRRRSPHHAAIWERTARAYDLIGRSAPQHRDRWGDDDHRPTSLRDGTTMGGPGSARGGRVRRVAGIAAGLGVLAMVVLLTVIQGGTPFRPSADYATATGESRSIALADGSTIYLGPHSAMNVVLSAQERRVTLVEGQAYFEVSADAGRPFLVRSGDTTVTVLGTAFDVERTGTGTVVTVRHGKVRVDDTSSATQVDLTAGDWIMAGQATSDQGSGQAADAGSWMRGQLVAHGRPVADVIGSLDRYFSGVILIADGSIPSRLVTGLYDLKSPARTLRELAASHDAEVWQISPWMLVVTPR